VPKIQRDSIPPALLWHLSDRVKTRDISIGDLQRFLAWLSKIPEVPTGPWFRRFSTFVVCGQGVWVKTFLAADQTAVGEEVD
jgi:hypothetical protein